MICRVVEAGRIRRGDRIEIVAGQHQVKCSDADS
jgi:MOSC domain-containing protein YiiM